ncbi:hypothetical protein D3C79_1075590 [compost metagenome]
MLSEYTPQRQVESWNRDRSKGPQCALHVGIAIGQNEVIDTQRPELVLTQAGLTIR